MKRNITNTHKNHISNPHYSLHIFSICLIMAPKLRAIVYAGPLAIFVEITIPSESLITA